MSNKSKIAGKKYLLPFIDIINIHTQTGYTNMKWYFQFFRSLDLTRELGAEIGL